MLDRESSEDDRPEREKVEEAEGRPKPDPAEEESLRDEERRARKARRVILIAQVVVAVLQAVDAVINLG